MISIIWDVYACSQYGHIATGVSNGTANASWSNICARCGAEIRTEVTA